MNQQEHGMICPESPRCKFTTPHAHRMEHHIQVTNHGRTRHEFRGHNSGKFVQPEGKGGKGKEAMAK